MHLLAMRKHRRGHGHTRAYCHIVYINLIFDVLAAKDAVAHYTLHGIFAHLFLHADVLWADGKYFLVGRIANPTY